MIILGRITKQIEKETNGLIKSAEIRIDDYHLNLHIPKEHEKELSNLGLNALEYARYIIENFTEIRQGKGTSYLLVAKHKTNIKLKNIAAIGMEWMSEKTDKGEDYYWNIYTMQPRQANRISKLKLYWRKK